MAAINFEELTILGGEFVNLSELPDADHFVIDVDEQNTEGGFHLLAKGSGGSFWASYDRNEYFLKFGRIAMMEEGEEWRCRQNNWYGFDETIEVLLKELESDNPNDRVEMLIKYVRETQDWERDINGNEIYGEEYEDFCYIFLSIKQKVITEYRKLYSFRKMWRELEDEIYLQKYLRESSLKTTEEEIIEEEIIEEL